MEDTEALYLVMLFLLLFCLVWLFLVLFGLQVVVEILSVLRTNKCAFFYDLMLFFLKFLILGLFKINLLSDVAVAEVVNFNFITCHRGKMHFL